MTCDGEGLGGLEVRVRSNIYQYILNTPPDGCRNILVITSQISHQSGMLSGAIVLSLILSHPLTVLLKGSLEYSCIGSY